MKQNKLNTFFTWFLIISAFLLPLFFLPYLINPFINTKLAVLFLLAFVSVFAFIGKSLKDRSWEFLKTPFTLPLIGFAVLIIISSLVNHQYPSKQLLGLGGAYLSFSIIALLAPSLIREKLSKWFILTINVAALILSILSIFQLFGIGLAPLFNRFSVLNLPNKLSFSLTGATFIAVQFLSVVLLSNVLDQKSWRQSIFNKLMIVVITVALGINIWAILPGGEAAFQNLSLVGSASIAKDSLTFTKNALFGYGPDSYGNAYNILKPIWINGLNYWKFTFDSAFNLPLTILVSGGLIAFLAYLIFLWRVFTSVKKGDDEQSFLKVFIISALFWQFLSPVNLVLLALLAIALAFFIKDNQNKYKKVGFSVHRLSDLINRGELSKIRNYVFVGTNVILFSLTGFLFYVCANTFIAYNLLYQSDASITKNEIAKAYDYQKKAKDLAPEIDFIRRSFSSINLQIAIALSNKADITQAEQEQVLQLVNQSIREAKAATVLDPNNYENWTMLAQIYMQLLGTTEQAEQEAFNALAKAATYNPSNPELRIVLGQLFLSTKKYPEAINFFNQAVERKPDLFIAQYYLANALAADKQLVEAKNTLVSSLNLLAKDSEEYKAVEKDLATLNVQIEEKAKAEKNNQGSDLTKGIPATDPTVAPVSTGSGLSSLLDKGDTENVIQDGALTSDQNLVKN